MNAPSLVRLVVLSALWGSSFLFMRIVAPLWGAVPTAFGRVLLGALGLMVLVVVGYTSHYFHRERRIVGKPDAAEGEK